MTPLFLNVMHLYGIRFPHRAEVLILHNNSTKLTFVCEQFSNFSFAASAGYRVQMFFFPSCIFDELMLLVLHITWLFPVCDSVFVERLSVFSLILSSILTERALLLHIHPLFLLYMYFSIFFFPPSRRIFYLFISFFRIFLRFIRSGASGFSLPGKKPEQVNLSCHFRFAPAGNGSFL